MMSVGGGLRGIRMGWGGGNGREKRRRGRIRAGGQNEGIVEEV